MKAVFLLSVCLARSLALPADISALMPRESDENKARRDERRRSAQTTRWEKWTEYQQWQRVHWQQWQEEQAKKKAAADEAAGEKNLKGRTFAEAKKAYEEAKEAADAAQKKA